MSIPILGTWELFQRTDFGTVSGTYNLTVAAGNRRKLLFKVVSRSAASGSLTTKLFNGITPTLAGQALATDGATNRVEVSDYYIDEADLPAAGSYSFTFSGSVSFCSVAIMCAQSMASGAPIDFEAVTANAATSPLGYTFTGLTNEDVVILGGCRNSTAPQDPAGDFVTADERFDDYGSGKPSFALTHRIITNQTSFNAAHAIVGTELKAVAGVVYRGFPNPYTVTSVGTGNVIRSQATNIPIVGTSLNTVTGATLSSFGLTRTLTINGGGSGTNITFNLPIATQGGLRYGPTVLSLTDGSFVLNINVTLLPPATHSWITLVNPLPRNNSASLLHNSTGNVPVTGMQNEAQDAANVTLNEQGGATFTATTNQVVFRTHDPADNTWSAFTTRLVSLGLVNYTGSNVNVNQKLIFPVSELTATSTLTGTITVSNLSPIANCAAAAVVGANVEVTPAINFRGQVRAGFTLTNGTASEGAEIQFAVNPINYREPFTWIFTASRSVILTATRNPQTGPELTDIETVAVTVT
ncbi:MAG: hypothetical protein V4629_03030 [Pseudomonadota bacterium]